MKQPAMSPAMRSLSGTETKARPWYRVENAFKDEENATDEKTTIYIYDEIGGGGWFSSGTSADDFVKMLSEIKSSEIELHLNSPGGDIFDGFAIYNALKAHPAKVNVVVDAMAASAASFIAQAGDKITMTKASTMMIHDGSAGAWGPAAVMRDVADLLDKFSNIAADIYASRAGNTSEFWRNLMIEEVWYNAQEAVDAGLADEVGADTKKEDEEAATNRWNLSVFNHVGRDSAPDPAVVTQRIANLLKEASVTTPAVKNEEKKETGSPETDPQAETTEGQVEEVDKEKEEQQPPSGPEVPKTENKNTANGDFKFTFKVNGQAVNDLAAVQNHITALEQWRDETQTQARKDFVTQLAHDNKIAATQIDALTAFALALTDSDQYEAWKGTWDSAVALPMLGTHGGAGTSNHDGTNTHAGAEAADELTLKKDIVTQHKRSGMKNEAIMQTDSYKRLMELDPTFKL
jgi:ATP-dependent protease ClpP protease subunit